MGAASAHHPPRVLCVAGTDPSGGAGLVADVKSVTALGGYAMGVVTAVTVQNTRGVQGVHPVPVQVVLDQLDAVADDVRIDAMKIGMLGRRELVEAVTDWVRRRRPPAVVLDPVMVATTGGALADDEASRALVDLARVCDLVTPNVPELGVLAGSPVPEDAAAIRALAVQLAGDLGTSVLATTGDLDGAVVDVLAEPSGALVELPYRRVATPNTHGTGCSLSSALATARSRRPGWVQAYDEVRPWLDGALRGGLDLDVGGGAGPLDHTWFLHR